MKKLQIDERKYIPNVFHAMEYLGSDIESNPGLLRGQDLQLKIARKGMGVLGKLNFTNKKKHYRFRQKTFIYVEICDWAVIIGYNANRRTVMV